MVMFTSSMVSGTECKTGTNKSSSAKTMAVLLGESEMLSFDCCSFCVITFACATSEGTDIISIFFGSDKDLKRS